MNGCSQVKRNGLIYAGSVVGMASEGEFDSEDSSEGGALQFWTGQTRHARARAPTQTHTNAHKRARAHTHTHTLPADKIRIRDVATLSTAEW
jgi:hypothetical protein